MNRFILVLILILGLLGYLSLREYYAPGPVPHRVLPAVPERPGTAPQSTTQNSGAAPSNVGDRRIHTRAKSPNGRGHKLDPNLVEFRVLPKLGLAVAFGDIVLGQPEDRGQGSGYFEPPTIKLWESLEIPYAVDPALANVGRVQKALDYLSAHTHLRFVPYQGEKDAIVFQTGPESCYSYLGRMGGLQPIFLAPGCQWDEVLHEMMHALGFIHEQSRPDRDSFLEVEWDNIDPKYDPQFEIAPENFAEPLGGAPFDYESRMLYAATAFAKNRNLPTLRSLTQESIRPHREGLSAGDIDRVNRLYR